MTKLEYENSLREVGWDKDCIFAAVHGFSMGYTRAIADVVEWFKSLDCACCEFCEQSSEVCFSQEIAEKIENKFLRGEK